MTTKIVSMRTQGHCRCRGSCISRGSLVPVLPGDSPGPPVQRRQPKIDTICDPVQPGPGMSRCGRRRMVMIPWSRPACPARPGDSELSHMRACQSHTFYSGYSFMKKSRTSWTCYYNQPHSLDTKWTGLDQKRQRRAKSSGYSPRNLDHPVSAGFYADRRSAHGSARSRGAAGGHDPRDIFPCPRGCLNNGAGPSQALNSYGAQSRDKSLLVIKKPDGIPEALESMTIYENEARQDGLLHRTTFPAEFLEEGSCHAPSRERGGQYAFSRER